MIFIARADGRFELPDRTVPCALGRGGVTPAVDKREGDGKTPLGLFPIRSVRFRADRRPAPITRLPVRPIAADDGWCDAPDDPNYNRPVKLPYPASAERLWREDHCYDLLVILGHNDDPPVAPLGSAIFLHLARPDFAPTDGCLALAQSDLEAMLAVAEPDSSVRIVDR